MLKWRWTLILLSLVAVMGTEFVLGASFNYKFEAPRNGHVWIWRTYNGVRLSTEAAIDADVVKGEVIYVSGDTEWCNDCDVKWDDADGVKNCNFVAHSYSYDTFEAFLAEHPGALVHYALNDVTGIEISADLELEVWHDFLQTNPIPDPSVTFEFYGGLCAQLPGYMAVETVSGLPFTGTCEVAGICTLSMSSQAVPTLSGWMLAVMVFILLLVAATFMSRLKARRQY